jgi:HPt (histidine-containing phosphotransfer) domain-containing protein
VSGTTGPEEDASLHEYFAGRLPERLREIEAAWQEARSAGRAGEPLRTLHRLAHSLAGAGATFGFPAVTAAARQLEKALQPAAQGTAPPPAEAGVEELLSGLRRAAAGG